MSLRKKIFSAIPTNLSSSSVSFENKYDKNKLAIIIHTCDSYVFCWKGWLNYFSKYWDFKLPFNIYFVNEEIDVDFDGIKQIKTGTGEWSTRLKKALKQISEKNILYLQEDVWLQSPIAINEVFGIFLDLKMNRLQLSPNDKFYTLFSNFLIGKYELGKFAKRSNYLISHQPSIWRKDFFIECLDVEESPWDNETNGTDRLRKRVKNINSYLLILDWYTAVSRGGKLTDQGLELERKIG